jgi:hypothetical protein
LEITFAAHAYNRTADLVLKQRLKEYFNRPEIQKKMEAVAQHIIPNPAQPHCVRAGYGVFMAPMLGVFGVTTISDGDPFNLCSALLRSCVDAGKDQTMSATLRADFEAVTTGMLAIVDKARKTSDLRNSIMAAAAAGGFMQERGKH